MHAIQVLDDENRSLAWTQTPDPEPRADEVIVAVHATAVNRADLLQRGGNYAPPPGASQILGLECAGIVEAVGADVPAELIGRRVAALLSGGGYAERVAVPAAHLLEIPDEMPFEVAAAIPEVFYTAYVNLVIEGRLTDGETVMVHAAASGVGTAALQICRELGCTVIATASGAKLEALGELGATYVVDRHTESFVDVVRDVTDDGVDLILDPVGANYFEDNIASLARQGRMVLIGLLSGRTAELNLATLLRRRLEVIGSVLRSRSKMEKTTITYGFRDEIWPWLCDQTIEPIIDRVLPIAQVEDAHTLIRQNETTGKVVLKIR